MIGYIIKFLVIIVPFILIMPYIINIANSVFEILLNNFAVDPLVAIFLLLFPMIIFFAGIYHLVFKVVLQ